MELRDGAENNIYEVSVEVKCVCCGFRKTVFEEQRDIPMCDKCFSPMTATEARGEKR